VLHAYILIFLKDRTICLNPSEIDKFISVEIPNKENDLQGYEVVENYMIHSPCGELNMNLVYMDGDRCTKHFSKGFNSKMTIDEEGFPVYKMGDDGRHIKKELCHSIQQRPAGQVPSSHKR
jgi:hypothetical protein